MQRSGPYGVEGVALPVVGSVVVGVLALTESFGALPGAVAAYAAAWWVLGLEPTAPTPGEQR
ncbi:MULTISPECIES: hypothetical protein [unclassified Nocardioides]|uniref:hypothetical protein n=1 Tax=unclassified Nocardioides TaxID=2615069 RepID=UPI00361B70D8